MSKLVYNSTVGCTLEDLKQEKKRYLTLLQVSKRNKKKFQAS